jgi:hypothetical protein
MQFTIYREWNRLNQNHGFDLTPDAISHGKAWDRLN